MRGLTLDAILRGDEDGDDDDGAFRPDDDADADATEDDPIDDGGEDDDGRRRRGEELHAHRKRPTGADAAPKDGFCVECEDQQADVHCSVCGEPFCDMCFASLHRKGTRSRHETRRLRGTTAPAPTGKRCPRLRSSSPGKELQDLETSADDAVTEPTGAVHMETSAGPRFGDWISERAKYIPIRLSHTERKQLRLLEAALNVSEYTDVVDCISYRNRTKRIIAQIKELCAIISGLVVASDYKYGQELFADRDFEANERFYLLLMEIGRRHKIMNPEKMRDAYGKLMYLLQDSMTYEVHSALNFNLVRDIKTVYSVLEEHEALNLLQDDRVAAACKEIIPDGKDRRSIQREIKEKERAVEYLAEKYQREGFSADTIRTCLYSIGDNHSYLRSNRDPCDRMLRYLTQNFHPTKFEDGFSLAIQVGRGGARLSHSHETQFYYCQQSLYLWREILHDMFMLWAFADADLLNPNGVCFLCLICGLITLWTYCDLSQYRLRDTGQGINRVQSCPKVSRAMHNILHRVQQKTGHWVGSSVIHLGDSNVPNALMFIDKYTQVQYILGPLCNIIERLDEIYENPACRALVDAQYRSPECARKSILADFFRYAFDGSGADNSFDAGSCIDGRLTSCWNWCSLVHKKPYYHIFLLCGFTGFNGQY